MKLWFPFFRDAGSEMYQLNPHNKELNVCCAWVFITHLQYLSGFSHHSGLLTGGPKGAPSIDCSLDYEVLLGVVWGCLSKC